MRVLIIEDEIPAANKLQRMLKVAIPEVEILARLESVEASVNFLKNIDYVDLIFMDIQLADGLCFNIFEQVDVPQPIIFTTAFNEYAMKAFKVNSIDYLLKPIEPEELAYALDKFRRLHFKQEASFPEKIRNVLQNFTELKYKERLLIKRGQQLNYLKIEDVAYFYADGKLCFAVDRLWKKYILDENLSTLEPELNPLHFFRINRSVIVRLESITCVHKWLGERLKVDFTPPNTEIDSLVSRERVQNFKHWLGGK